MTRWMVSRRDTGDDSFQHGSRVEARPVGRCPRLKCRLLPARRRRTRWAVPHLLYSLSGRLILPGAPSVWPVSRRHAGETGFFHRGKLTGSEGPAGLTCRRIAANHRGRCAVFPKDSAMEPRPPRFSVKRSIQASGRCNGERCPHLPSAVSFFREPAMSGSDRAVRQMQAEPGTKHCEHRLHASLNNSSRSAGLLRETDIRMGRRAHTPG